MNVTLRPNRELLDSNFESYKLGVDDVPISQHPIDPIDIVEPPENYSKQQLKAYSKQNCLFINTFAPGMVYFVSEIGRVGNSSGSTYGCLNVGATTASVYPVWSIERYRIKVHTARLVQCLWQQATDKCHDELPKQDHVPHL